MVGCRCPEERGAEDGDGGLAVLPRAFEARVVGMGEERDERLEGRQGGELGGDEAFVVCRDGECGVHEGRSKHNDVAASTVFRA